MNMNEKETFLTAWLIHINEGEKDNWVRKPSSKKWSDKDIKEYLKDFLINSFIKIYKSL